MIGAHGERLLGWLERHVFPAERRLEDPAHARHVADVFLRECLRAGTTTVAAYCSVHAHSVDAFFEAAERHRMRVIAGKVLMDRHAPAWLLDTPERGHDESKALLERWHGRGRALYAVTPRFVGTSSPAQLEAAAALWRAHDGTWLQTHLAESRDEVAWVAELFPGCRDYVEVLERHGLVGPRALLGHGVWLDDDAAARLRASGAALVHCPTSNAFLGSGLFRLRDLRGRHAVPTALGTDVGAGTSFSLLQVMGEAYKAAQLGGATLDPLHALYLATRGAAEAAGLAHRVGSIAPGLEADVVVLDLRSTPLIDFRMDYCESLADELFLQMTLGDDRAVRATYVAGRCAHRRP
jgi:guanine deaminase